MKLDVERIKQHLFKNKKYQYQLADELQISEAVLSKIIRGRIKPSQFMVEQIDRILKGQRKKNRELK